MKIKEDVVPKLWWFFLLVLLMGCGPSWTIQPPISNKPPPTPTERFYDPLPGARRLSPFGPRGKSYHTGIDLQKNRKGGDQVLASRSGKVVAASAFSGYGKAVMILHKDGYRTRYAHLRAYRVKVGQNVRRGDIIGIVGQTGRATTPHLHFEVLTPGGRFINPEYFLN